MTTNLWYFVDLNTWTWVAHWYYMKLFVFLVSKIVGITLTKLNHLWTNVSIIMKYCNVDVYLHYNECLFAMITSVEIAYALQFVWLPFSSLTHNIYIFISSFFGFSVDCKIIRSFWITTTRQHEVKSLPWVVRFEEASKKNSE